MKKVIVIGCPGSGKSTFSRKLHRITGIPLYHLDMMYWNADRTTVDKAVFHERLFDTIKKSEWIIDGNYGSTMELRLKECDTVIFLDYPLEICLEGIKERRGKVRTDMPWVESEDDEDVEFIEFIKNYNVQSRPQVMELLDKYSDKNIIIFKDRDEADEFLKNMKNLNSLLETTQNTRDLGGYKKEDGTYTKGLSIIRSDVQNYPSENDIKWLRSNKITTIIDMRGEKDVIRKPSGFADVEDFLYYNFQINEGSGVPENFEAVPLSYMKIAEAKAMPEVFRCIADAPDGVMFNCTAGKDRTGVVSAILLMHAGVCDEEIVNDYILTKEYGKERLALVHKNFPELDMRIVTPCKFFMEEFLRLFREKYRNTDNYFKSIGLSDDEVRRIKEKL